MTIKTGLTAMAAVLSTAAAAPAMADQTQHDIPPLSEWSYNTLYEQGGLHADNLMGAEVFSKGGEEVGSVENILINDQNQIQAIIAQVGGVWDIGDTHILVPWSETTLTEDGVKIPVNEDNADEYGLFSKDSITADALNNTQQVSDNVEAKGGVWKASDLLDDYVSLADGTGYGYLTDILFTTDGNIQSIIVDASESDNVTAGTYAYPFYGYGYGWSPADTSYVLSYDVNDLKNMTPFDDDQYEDQLDD
ncbi:PRC-barrel domain-containing protein [Kushneria konosiri]|nr:PRC-barrel domain-containing protein [Kushneria konosiri]